MKDICIDLVAVSDYHGQRIGLKEYDAYKSRMQTHGCVLLVNIFVKSNEVKELVFEKIDVALFS